MWEILKELQGFEWDEGNSGKNEQKHGVTDREAEEIFFNKPLIVGRSLKGQPEVRYAALGRTYGSRLLTVVFTTRARDLRLLPELEALLELRKSRKKS